MSQASGKQGGLVVFGLFLAAVVVLGAGVIYFAGFDRPLAARINPETEDAYGDGEYTPLSARVDGYITAILIQDNQTVHAGDVLMRVERDNYVASVRQLEAQVAAAQASLAALQEGAQTAQAQAVQAQALLSGTRAQATYAAQEDVRQHMNLPTDLGLLRAVQEADADRGRLASETARQEAVMDGRRWQIEIFEAQVQQQKDQIAVLNGDLALARIRLAYCDIRAPFDGTLGMRGVRVGDLVRPGQVVIPITPLRHVWVTASFAETQITDIHVGQAARIRLDAYPNRDLPGQVVGLAPLTGQSETSAPPDNATGNYTKVVQRIPVKIEFTIPNDDPAWGLIRPGLSALARVDTNGHPGVQTAR